MPAKWDVEDPKIPGRCLTIEKYQLFDIYLYKATTEGDVTHCYVKFGSNSFVAVDEIYFEGVFVSHITLSDK